MSDDLSISDVAKAAGLSRVTIYKCINSGELSVSVNPVNGVKTVSKSELSRFLSVRGVKREQSINSQPEQQLTSQTVNILQERVKGLEAQLKTQELLIEEQRKRLLLLEDLRGTQTKSTEFVSDALHVTQNTAGNIAPNTNYTGTVQHKPKRGLLSRVFAAAIKAGLEN